MNKETDIANLQYNSQNLISDLRQIIDKSRQHVATTANYELTMMYWYIGERINREILGNERAEYGKKIVTQVAAQLQKEYETKGFDTRNIRRMMQFARMFPDIRIVTPLATQLSWSHFLLIMTIKEPLAREFYLTMAAMEKWTNGALLDAVLGIADLGTVFITAQLASIYAHSYPSFQMVIVIPQGFCPCPRNVRSI